MKITIGKTFVVVAALLMCAGGASLAAELHPIVEVQDGYLFGSNALPRKPKVIDTTQKAYVDVVRDFLETKEIKQPKVKIDSILRVDLDGDGEEEVLISVANYFAKADRVPMRSPAGSYSMVLLRRVVAGKVETRLVAGEFHPKAYVSKEGSFDAPSIYKVIATLDLDGDGKLEVVVGSNYYEGEEITIYRCDPKKVETLLSVACGA